MKHTIINPIAALLLLAVGLAGCSKEGTDTLDTWNGEIRLGSEIASQVKTRATVTDVPDRQIASDKVVLFYVDDAGAGVAKKNLYESYAMTADGNGGFTKYNLSAEDMYFPATGNGVDIYAFLTDGFVDSPTFPTSAITHEVKSDQSTQYGDNYLDSDLLYAANKAVARTSDDVNLTFYHMLSKVEVALKAGVGAPDLTGAVVTIENTQLKADFLPDKAKDINDPATGQDTRAAMVTLTANNNPITPITVGTSIETDAFDDATTYASAVVVPQTVAQNKRFIKVTLASGGELYYTIPDMGGLELESGNKYQFKITVNLTELTVKSTIADWATNTPIDGTSELPMIGSKTDPATAAVGDFYFKDGSLETSTATLTPDQQAACIGIVYWMGDIVGDNYGLLDEKFPDGTHGLVLSLCELKDPDTQYPSMSTTYGQSESVTGWLSSSIWTGRTRPNDFKSITVSDKMQGYANTLALHQYNKVKSASQFTDETDYKRRIKFITPLVGFASNSPAPPTSSGWYIASIMEKKYIIWGQGNEQGVVGEKYLNEQIAKTFGVPMGIEAEFQLSSTEDPDWPQTDILAVGISSGNCTYFEKKKLGAYRPILAF